MQLYYMERVAVPYVPALLSLDVVLARWVQMCFDQGDCPRLQLQKASAGDVFLLRGFQSGWADGGWSTLQRGSKLVEERFKKRQKFAYFSMGSAHFHLLLNLHQPPIAIHCLFVFIHTAYTLSLQSFMHCCFREPCFMLM